jgi:hypothetical protein
MSAMPQERFVNERGSALVYILIAIALLAALTISFMQPSSQQVSSNSVFKAVSEISSQVDFIRSAVQECVLVYPEGDANMIAPIADPEVNLNHPYPVMPDSGYYTAKCPSAAAVDHQVAHLRCPGKPGSDNPCHEPLFGGNTGKFMPPPPALFSAWQYYSGADGVFFWIETDKTDPFIDSVLEKLDDAYAACEADVTDARTAAQNLDGDGAVACPLHSRCFRVWMIRNTTCP